MTIQIEIDQDKLMQLFEEGGLCAADFRCLNGASKKHVTQLCLNNCIKNMKETKTQIPL